MAQIVLTTLNARYHHTSLALHTLYANLKNYRTKATIKEFTIKDDPLEMIHQIALEDPIIVTFGVYIWNITQITTVVTMLKRIYPDLIVIIGGPEVSYEFETLPLFHTADYLIKGEGEIPLYQLCNQIILGERPSKKVIEPVLTDLATLESPYQYYSEETIKNRVIYLETSRGCPYRCHFCLSALDQQVRYFPIKGVLREIANLWERGVRQFKFIDRTFNLKFDRCEEILNLFLEQNEPYFLHFELVPDRIPDRLKELILKFPAGSLQFEVGLQSMDETVLKRIGRKQNMSQTLKNLQFLFEKSGAHIHTDLIIGLPGESKKGFAKGFNLLMSLNPDEVQVGVLKRLRGALIERFDTAFQMVYAPTPPYQILQTGFIPFSEMVWLIRFAKYWDLFYNNGYLKRSIKLIFNDPLYFEPFMDLTHFAFERLGRIHSISLNHLAETLFLFLVEKGINTTEVAQTIGYDLLHTQKRKIPPFLKPYREEIMNYINCDPSQFNNLAQPKRQQRHQSPRKAGDKSV